MKIKSIIAATFVILGFTMTSCEYDNYDAPSYVFSGQLKCDGENFPFDSNRGLLRVFQKGYGKSTVVVRVYVPTMKDITNNSSLMQSIK